MQQTSLARPAVPVRVEPRTRDVTVLIVCADADLRAAAERVASGEGYRTVTARHAGHAILACLTDRIDIVATELSMEDMSGPALAARLRKHHPALAAVYFGNAGTRECDGVLVRPFTGDDLARALAAACASVSCTPTSSVA